VLVGQKYNDDINNNKPYIDRDPLSGSFEKDMKYSTPSLIYISAHILRYCWKLWRMECVYIGLFKEVDSWIYTTISRILGPPLGDWHAGLEKIKTF